MYHTPIDFIDIAGAAINDKLDAEFQYQMSLTDGKYVIYERKLFDGHHIETASTATSQAILQYFAAKSCPISCLRLGRALSLKNYQHGPIVSDDLAMLYLIRGFEGFANLAYDPEVSVLFDDFKQRREYMLACELMHTYLLVSPRQLCSEVLSLIQEGLEHTRPSGLQ